MSSSDRLALGAHSFTTSSGATLTYFVTGHGPNLLVNVAPGWGAASLLYQNSFKYLEDRYTFVHLEVRGTRESSWPEDLSEMSSWHMSEDVESLRIHLGLDQINLSGHSNGACIALWVAIRFPNSVRRLIVVESQVLGEKVSAEATKAILARRPDRDAVNAFLNRGVIETDEQFGAVLGAFLSLYLANPERDLESFKSAFTNTPQIKCSKAQGAAERQHADQIDHLNKITAPTLIIVGREDFITPVPESEVILERIANSKLVIVEDSGHIPWIEQKEVFAQALADFFV